MLKRPIMRDGYAVRVCYAMAPKDPARARRIAGKISDPYAQAYTLGQMALALSPSDKPAAAQLVDDALSSLAAVAAQKKETYVNTQSAASTAATLLEVMERIDPQRVPEVLRRTLALRGPRCEEEREENGRLGADGVIAMLVLPYDRSIAQALLDPLLVRLPRLISGGVSYFANPLFAAPAFIDPQRAVALVAGLPTEPHPLRRQGWTRERNLVVAHPRVPGARSPAPLATDDRLLESRRVRPCRRRLTGKLKERRIETHMRPPSHRFNSRRRSIHWCRIR